MKRRAFSRVLSLAAASACAGRLPRDLAQTIAVGRTQPVLDCVGSLSVAPRAPLPATRLVLPKWPSEHAEDALAAARFDSDAFARDRAWTIVGGAFVTSRSSHDISLRPAGPGSAVVSPLCELPVSATTQGVDLSVLIGGYVGSLLVQDEKGRSVWMCRLYTLLPERSEPFRFRTYIPPAAIGDARALRVRIQAPVDPFFVPDESIYVGSPSLLPARRELVSTERLGLSATGCSLVRRETSGGPRWLDGQWNAAEIVKSFCLARKCGRVVRLWMSLDTLSRFDSDGVWTGFRREFRLLEKLLMLAHEAGLQVIATLFSQTQWSEVGYSSRIPDDERIAQGYVAMCSAGVEHLHSLPAIVAWDPCNEAFDTTLNGTRTGYRRAFARAGSRVFLEQLFSGIRAIDSRRPVISTFGSGEMVLPLIEPETYCTAVGYSLYYGRAGIVDPQSIPRFSAAQSDRPALDYLASQRLPMIASEVGAPAWDYRNPVSNASAIEWYLTHLWKYGFEAVLPYRDKQVLWADDGTVGPDGLVLQAAARRLTR